MLFDLDQQAECVEIGDDLLARGVAIEAVVLRAWKVDARGLVEDGEAWQVVALADGEVVGVVRGRDLDGARAELRVGPVVGDDGISRARSAGSAAACRRAPVALVGRVDGHGDIAQHGLGARGGDDDGAGTVGEG